MLQESLIFNIVENGCDVGLKHLKIIQIYCYLMMMRINQRMKKIIYATT